MKVIKYLKSVIIVLIVALVIPVVSGNIYAQDKKGTEIKTTHQPTKTKKHHRKHHKKHKKYSKSTKNSKNSDNNKNTQKK